MRKFTLIELLVVVAIIGILTSMLLPSLSEARARGKSAVCISNLKQIGITNYNYSSDENNSFPTGLIDNGDGSFNQDHDPDGYENGLMPYLGYAAKTFECPGFERGNFAGSYDRRGIVDDKGETQYSWRTYRPNNFRYTNTPEGSDGRWKNGLIKFNYSMKFSQVANDTILDGDYVRSYSYANFGRSHYWDRRGASFGNHLNKWCNLLFVDGSARLFMMKGFLSNTGLIFGSSSTFSYEGNTNNFGLFSANMAPSGSFWTVVED